MYVSLYGLTSVREIEDEFQRQLHPILSSKEMKTGWAVAKGLSMETGSWDLRGRKQFLEAWPW
jgi:hypothetical protein